MSARAIRRALARQAQKLEKKNQVATPGPVQSLPANEAVPSITGLGTGHSTGPRTEAGKEISSRNAISHGVCAVNTLILPTEDPAEYARLEKTWFEGYSLNPDRPNDKVKAELVRSAARAAWFLLRAERNYGNVEAGLLTESPNMFEWTDQQHRSYSRALRYRTANANLLAKARKELEYYIKARTAEAVASQKMRHKDERLQITHDRIEVQRLKSRPPNHKEGNVSQTPTHCTVASQARV